MFLFPPTIILRHRRENLKKCTLRGLESRSDSLFFTYPQDPLPAMPDYILLGMEGPCLSKADQERGVFLIDGTWRYAALMERQTLKSHPYLVRRSLPSHILTAYPRRQEDCPDPEKGLASVEALFVAYALLGRPLEGLLDGYYWKEEFLKKNLDGRGILTD